ncbi:translation initiation factor eIF-2B subunit epsilon [Geosmithia morbida]|uniref:Translation initiation factor eIF2B subunit epsilon n=1 Tax=Geosmithia morbida TaxID=1094350 RepID=A0A9P4YQZ1_9HYPO|nr:translation initiation factor eIF-2B subunit epsilon [Geosmithia morbida]KAF4121506.1 translation initiation factor eIF-2B subunit epsilon [Geosmithia morbida]
MSHKGKNASASKGKKKSGGETKSEDHLQAVCLLPLANTPLIEYTFEFLAMNGVDQVYIYCGAHTDQVESYVNGSRWATTSRTSPFSVVQFVRVADARSVGDVLRDMDKRSLVDGDFLLVHGDLVSNILLDGVLAAHKKRREESAANIMTMVLTSAGAGGHRTKPKGITPIFAIDSVSGRCLHYDEVNALSSERYVMLDPAVPEELSTDFEIRADLVDAQVDICTPEVLALWSESFDYELPRRNFLHGVLKDWELNGKMIYADVVKGGYAARASNLQMYDAISRDVLDGWTAPFSPLTNMLPAQALNYRSRDGAVAMEDGVDCARDAVLRRSVVGSGASIGKGSTVSNSFVGRGCKIGANVVLEDSFLWEGAAVGDNSRVTRAVVADKAVIGRDCTIQPGSLVSFGVRVSDKTTLAPGSSVSTVTWSAQPAKQDTSLLGPSTNAAAFVDPDDDDADSEDPSRLQKSLIYSLAEANVSTSSVSTLSSDVDSDSGSDDEVDTTHLDPSARSRLSSFTSDGSGDGTVRAAFHHDAVSGLLDALCATSGDFDSAKLEFMGLRLANNASDTMMRRAIASAFAHHAVELLTPENGGLEPAKAAERTMTARPGAAKFVSEVAVGDGASETDQADFVLALQRGLRQASSSLSDAQTDAEGAAKLDVRRVGTLLAALLQQLYSLDIIEEEGILAWWADDRAGEGEGMVILRDKCKCVVDWLENAEEEDDSDEDDSE